ncbi:MAG: S-layer homology domain-containing protein [Clostridia bacterium]|nr:S-layer homology domain-containing protein [Clostridia bacterium]
MKNVKRILIVMVLLSVLSNTVYGKEASFSDIKDHWAEREIIELTNQGVISGYPDGTFRPDANISRSEFSTLMYRILGLKEVSNENIVIFQEIEGMWSEKFIEALVDKAVIIPDEYLHGYLADGEITRVEIAKMIMRAMGKDKSAKEITVNTKFDDDGDIKKEDRGYIYLAEYHGIISGYPDNTFKPDGLATRAEAVKMMITYQKTRETGEAKRDKKSNTHRTKHADSKVQFSLPQYTHTDKEVKIEVTAENVKELIWKLEKQNENGEMIEVEFDKYTENTLDNTGGEIRFTAKGSYALTVVAVNYGNNEFQFKKSIEVYPIPQIDINLPEYAHTDEEVNLVPAIEELNVKWSLLKEGQIVDISTYTEGNLDNSGGVVKFKENGSYNLKAKIVDGTGREFEFENSIEVYPVIMADFELSETTHTDNDISIVTSLQNLGSNDIVWNLEKEGQIVDISTYTEGNLDNNGGVVRFRERGIYNLKAKIVDETGREFEFEDSIEVYPIITVAFDLPKTVHTDNDVKVVTTSQHLGSNHIVWHLDKKGEKVNISKYIEGALKNEGGAVTFKEKGSYTLKAIVTDEIGRIFEFEDSIEVYPLITVEFDLPETAHTDSSIDVLTSLNELGLNYIVWGLAKDGQIVDISTYVEGNLDNKGGMVRFKKQGNYILKAKVTDENGREFEFENSIKVYPLITMEFDLPATGHTDSNVNVVTTLQNLGSNNVVWSLEKDGQVANISKYIGGSLNNNGGELRFKEKGNYTLKTKVTDETGREFEFADSVKVYTVIKVSFTLPETAHTDSNVNVVTTLQNLGSNNILWTLQKDGKPVDISTYIEGSLDNNGGIVRVKEKGNYTLKARITDEIGRAFEYQNSIEIYPIPQISFNLPNSLHIGKNFNLITNPTNLETLDVVWSLSKNNQPVSLSNYVAGTLDNNGGNIHFKETGHYTLIGTITDSTNRVFTYSDSVSVTNNAPSTPSITANVTRQILNGKFKVNLNVSSTDPDGDSITYEYIGKAADNYYPVGGHTVKVRAKDSYGLYSEWGSVNFNVINNPPTAPVITRTPDGNSVPPNNNITITASSNDPDGDDITYVWEGRVAETGKYPLGKNVVKVKAVDEAGAESLQAAIVFFVADAKSGGGMTLVDKHSTLVEEGIEGATITKYTFTVPPVRGHSGNDFGRIRGFNLNTNSWEQIDRRKTRNGITMTGTLPKGKYKKLEFYYFASHCMYGKSNITYSVEYYFHSY